jgi:hypothetical protein
LQIRVVAALLLAAACARGAPIALIHTAAGVVEVALEVVDTPAARERGLMYRSSLADGHGMLFVFPEEADHHFWMKNTLIPLDLLFIGPDRRVVGLVREAEPLSTVPRGVGRPSRWVLEVPGGFAARRGIAVGDRVELRGLAP